MKTPRTGISMGEKGSRATMLPGDRTGRFVPSTTDMVAFVRYRSQQTMISLNPYDGWETWHKIMSGLAPVPFEVVLKPDRGSCSHDHGVSIVDRRSYLEAMKIVERARANNEALHFQLYPIRDETEEVSANPGPVPFDQFVPTLNTSKKDAEMRAKIQKIALSEKTRPSAPQEHNMARTLESKLNALPKDDEFCPEWALELKKEIFDLIDRRFEELSTSIHSEISSLSSQMSSLSSPRMSQSDFSHKSTDSYGSGLLALSGQLVEDRSSIRQINPNGWTATTSVNERSNFGVRDNFGGPGFGAPLVASAPSFEVSHMPANTPKSSPSRSDSGSGSVVVVTPSESFALLGEHGHILPETGEFEVIHAPAYEDHNSETGSVAYVDTENEDDNDMASLKSWAQDASTSSTVHSDETSPMTESFMTTKNASLNNSFHSVPAEEEEPVGYEPYEEEIFHETIVYKPIPVPMPAVDDVEDGQFDQEDEVQSLVGNDPLAADQAGNGLLPPDLNAMQPLDDQTTFSPNSDLGTMLLSAASSIANGFMQSMESLSQTIRAYEERRNQAEQERRRSSTVETLNQSSVVYQEEAAVQVDEIPIHVEQEVSAPVEVPPPIPPRSRGPPPSNGQYMSHEEIQWFAEQYGIKDWWNEHYRHPYPITHVQFNERVNQHFDSMY